MNNLLDNILKAHSCGTTISFKVAIGKRVRIIDKWSLHFEEEGIIIGEVRWGMSMMSRIRLDNGKIEERQYHQIEEAENEQA